MIVHRPKILWPDHPRLLRPARLRHPPWILQPAFRTPASLARDEFNKGVDFQKKEDWDTAIACYTEAIRLKPDYANPYFGRGIAYDEKGEYDKAIKDHSEAIRLKPDDPDFYNNRGVTHQKNGDQSKADADFAKANALKAKAKEQPASSPN